MSSSRTASDTDNDEYGCHSPFISQPEGIYVYTLEDIERLHGQAHHDGDSNESSSGSIDSNDLFPRIASGISWQVRICKLFYRREESVSWYKRTHEPIPELETNLDYSILAGEYSKSDLDARNSTSSETPIKLSKSIEFRMGVKLSYLDSIIEHSQYQIVAYPAHTKFWQGEQPTWHILTGRETTQPPRRRGGRRRNERIQSSQRQAVGINAHNSRPPTSNRRPASQTSRRTGDLPRRRTDAPTPGPSQSVLPSLQQESEPSTNFMQYDGVEMQDLSGPSSLQVVSPLSQVAQPSSSQGLAGTTLDPTEYNISHYVGATMYNEIYSKPMLIAPGYSNTGRPHDTTKTGENPRQAGSLTDIAFEAVNPSHQPRDISHRGSGTSLPGLSVSSGSSPATANESPESQPSMLNKYSVVTHRTVSPTYVQSLDAAKQHGENEENLDTWFDFEGASEKVSVVEEECVREQVEHSKPFE